MSPQTVNHSIHFVDPSTGAYTQGIESTWAATKRMMRKKGVMGKSKFEEDTFNTILDHICRTISLTLITLI